MPCKKTFSRLGPLVVAVALAPLAPLPTAADPHPDQPDETAVRRLIRNLEILQGESLDRDPLAIELQKQEQELVENLKSLAAQIEELDAALTEAERQREELQRRSDSDEIGDRSSRPPEVQSSDPTLVQSEFVEKTVDFQREIRPILSDNCFACHGPDENQRKAGLRFDDGEGGYKKLRSGGFAIVPGKRHESELFRRITAKDPADRMPPEKSGKSLSDEQIELLGKWIDEGAEWKRHWAFITPKRPAPPAVHDEEWVRNPIDRFILEKLHENGLSPSPGADRETLIRRVTLDLTGLPPTSNEIDSFLEDDSPNAYDKVVKRLLESPRYGEHNARYWLDLARYADTHGYHIDAGRTMWRWRDWVIQAFNENKPFDEFTIEQIAGDLLPNPTLDQFIATGFNRNHMINFEGGAIPEEYRVQYVIDRLTTTATSWMGLTIGCAQCHEHKYDPISQREFYQMFAFFNTIPEKGLDGRKDNAAPLIKTPTRFQAQVLAGLDRRIEEEKGNLLRENAELDQKQVRWEEGLTEKLNSHWTPLRPLDRGSTEAAGFDLNRDLSLSLNRQGRQKPVLEADFHLPDFKQFTGIQFEAFPSEPAEEDGGFAIAEFEAEIVDASSGNVIGEIEFASAFAGQEDKDHPVHAMIDNDPKTGWSVGGEGKRETRIARFLLHDPVLLQSGSALRVRLHRLLEGEGEKRGQIGRFRISMTREAEAVASQLGPWRISGPYQAQTGLKAYHTVYPPEIDPIDLTAVYPDQRQKWVRLDDVREGEGVDLLGEHCATYVYRKILAPTDRFMKIKVDINDAAKIWLNGELVDEDTHPRSSKVGYQPTLSLKKGENHLLLKVVHYAGSYSYGFTRISEQMGGIPFKIEKTLARSAGKRSVAEKDSLRIFFRRRHDPRFEEMYESYAVLLKEREKFKEDLPSTMVMEEMEEVRDTFVLIRGQYDQPGDKVRAAVPAILPALPKEADPNRLGFAKWLVSPDHPLTARVAVNRFWQRFFGTGIVKTAEDFGSQGEWPSHPGLLDWLAVEFMESGWDLKYLQRLVVTSAAYRQSSRAAPELLEADPYNRLISRGPRFRMDAEMVRDNALAISGLLEEKIGGPSVKPYQPRGLWEEVAFGAEFSAQTYEQDQGENLYRRSMYTFWKRQCPPPSMLLFDAPNREVCTSSRARTNTPLQALALLNDPQFVEASRGLAAKVLTESGPSPESRIRHAFRLATARFPTNEELDIFLNLYRKSVQDFESNVDRARDFVSVGESKVPENRDPIELAAWTQVANTVLNLDEAITKN